MKFGFIGYGSIAKKHIQAISVLYKHAVIILIRRNTQDPIDKVENLDIIVSDNLIDLSTVDVIFVTNPTSEHINSIKKILEFRKPIFVEKPIASQIENLLPLIEQIDKAGIINYVACNLRFHPCIEFLKEKLLTSITINEVNIYCGSYLPDWRPESDFRNSYSANPKMGGGVHLDLIHEIDYCYYLFGTPEKIMSSFSNRSSLNISAVDFAHYSYQYKHFSVQITLNYYRRDYKRTIELVSDDATYIIDLKECSITKNGNTVFLGNKDFSLMYQDQINYFVNQVKKNEKCFNSMNEAYHVLKLCLNES